MGACGGASDSFSGTFTSPSYPNSYPYDENCVYTVSQISGKFIILTVEEFEIEDSGGCDWDFLEIRDGSSADSRVIGKFCGTNIPKTLHTTQNKMWIRYDMIWWFKCKPEKFNYSNDKYEICQTSQFTDFYLTLRTMDLVSKYIMNLKIALKPHAT